MVDGFNANQIDYLGDALATHVHNDKANDKRTKGEGSCGKSLSTMSSPWMGIIPG